MATANGGKIGVFFKGGRVQQATFSGTVLLNGAPVARDILVYLERAPEILWTTTSSGVDGSWSITINLPYDDTARIICVGEAGENSAIYEHMA